MSRIIYRPHRGQLDDAMREAQIFESEEILFLFLTVVWDHMFSKNDIVISDNHSPDHRIDWLDSRTICVKRMGKDIYEVPQAIGFVAYEFPEDFGLTRMRTWAAENMRAILNSGKAFDEEEQKVKEYPEKLVATTNTRDAGGAIVDDIIFYNSKDEVFSEVTYEGNVEEWLKGLGFVQHGSQSWTKEGKQ